MTPARPASLLRGTSPRPTFRRGQRGVTLIEIMIAVAITAVMGVMVMGAFQRIYAAKELTEAQDERFSSAQVALSRISRELSQAFLSDHYDRKRFREPSTIFRGKDGGERDDLLFATMSHARLVRDAKESDQAVVEYTVEPDPDRSGENVLFRREKARIDDDPERGGAKDDWPLHRSERRRSSDHQDDVRRMGRAQHPGERHPPGLDQHRPDPRDPRLDDVHPPAGRRRTGGAVATSSMTAD